MKKALLSLILFLVLITPGYAKEKPVILLNSQPITQETVNCPVQNFSVDQKINYVLITPKGFTDSVLRVQIVKKEEKVDSWGYSVYTAKDVCIDKNQKFYIDYLTVGRPGCYIMSIYEIKDLNKPLARTVFWVK